MSNSNEKGSTLVSQSQKDNKSVKIKKRHKKRKFFQISSQSNEVDDNKTQQVPQEIHSEEIKHQKKKRKRSKHQKNKETLSINWQEVRFDTAEAQLTHFWALYVQTLGEKLSVLELEDTLPSAGP
jgi:tRNA U54 and U55 pseudouridine synthase Pus10